MITLLKDPNSAISDATFQPLTWANPTNCFTSNIVYATTTPTVAGNVAVVDLQVILQTATGVITGNNKADTITAWSTTDSYISYGGQDDKWGANLTPAIVNDKDFGVGVACTVQTSGSARLYASNFLFNIPTSAVIRGIKVDVEKSKFYTSRGNTTIARINHIRMTIYYGFPHLHHFE